MSPPRSRVRTDENGPRDGVARDELREHRPPNHMLSQSPKRERDLTPNSDFSESSISAVIVAALGADASPANANSDPRRGVCSALQTEQAATATLAFHRHLPRRTEPASGWVRYAVAPPSAIFPALRPPRPLIA
jgi:hypothetical protein